MSWRFEFCLSDRNVLSMDVEYRLRPAPSGSEVKALISVEGRGLFGRVLAKAKEALLARGALRTSLERLAREVRAGTGNVGCGAC
jgi:hypothetical protein